MQINIIEGDHSSLDRVAQRPTKYQGLLKQDYAYVPTPFWSHTQQCQCTKGLYIIETLYFVKHTPPDVNFTLHDTVLTFI